jgi:hypothetical protein
MKSRRRIAFPKAQTARLGFAITAGISDRRNGVQDRVAGSNPAQLNLPDFDHFPSGGAGSDFGVTPSTSSSRPSAKRSRDVELMRLPRTLRRSPMLESYPTPVLHHLRPRRPYDRPPLARRATYPNGKQISNSRYIGTMPTLDFLTL